MNKNKILLVERNKPVTSKFKRAMADNDIEVDNCYSVDDLRKKFDKLDEYEIVLIDIDYKSMLNEMLEVSDKPFYIIWTNESGCSPEIAECLEMGASLYLKKDQDMKKLVSLAKHINKAYVSNYI